MITALLLFLLRAFDVANGGESLAVVLGDELLGGRVLRIGALLELELRLALQPPLLLEVTHRRALQETRDELRLHTNRNILLHIIKNVTFEDIWVYSTV